MHPTHKIWSFIVMATIFVACSTGFLVHAQSSVAAEQPSAITMPVPKDKPDSKSSIPVNVNLSQTQKVTPASNTTRVYQANEALPHANVSHTVTFDKADGVSSPEIKVVSDGYRVEWPTQPVRNGYLFDGWFVGEVAYDFDQPVTTDLSLTAHWSKANSTWEMSPDHGPTSGGTQLKLSPPPARGIRFSQIYGEYQSSIAMGSDGEVYTWGRNDAGMLGDGTDIDRETAVIVPKPAGVNRFKQISAGGWHSLAIDDHGDTWAWGENEYGQLGDGITTPPPVYGEFEPKKVVVPAGTHFSQVSAGYWHTVAIDDQGKLWGWGYNLHGEIGDGTTISRSTPTKANMPDGVNRFIRVTTRGWHTFALDDQNQWWAWGLNDNNQISSDSQEGILQPTKLTMPAGVSHYTQINPGYGNTFALDTNGQWWAWGSNYLGALGDGTMMDRPIPIKISLPAGVSRFVTVEPGGNYSAALDDQGQVWTWGDNRACQLGDGNTACQNNNSGSTIKSLTPVKVIMPAGITHFTKINLGYFHSFAFDDKGRMWTWGSNKKGQLGDATTINRSIPVRLQFPDTIPTEVTFDGKPGTGLDRNGDGTWKVITPPHAEGPVDARIAWKVSGVPQPDAHLTYTYDFDGHIVTFDKADGSSPVTKVRVPHGSPVRWPADPVRAGYIFDGWFTADGKAWDFNQIVTQDMTLTARWETCNCELKPTQGPTTGGNTTLLTGLQSPKGITYTQVVAGERVSLASGSNGKIYAWGDNNFGQLGTGNTTSTTTPVEVERGELPAGEHFLQISPGYEHSAALATNGKIYAWGRNQWGELGNGNTTDATTPVEVKQGALPAGERYIQISVNNDRTIALASNGKAYTWGWNEYGQLGNGNSGVGSYQTTPVEVAQGALPAGEHFTQVSAGYWHTLALASNGKAYSWGSNGSGQAGDGNRAPYVSQPIEVAQGAIPVGEHFTQISAGSGQSLAIASNGKAYAWGGLGNGQSNGIYLPQPEELNRGDLPANEHFSQISAGYTHSLAVASNGKTYAWGNNSKGALGIGSTIDQSAPTEVKQGELPVGEHFTYASSGYTHSLALGSNGKIYSWGDNDKNELGNGDNNIQITPVEVGFSKRPVKVTGITFDTTDSPAFHWSEGRNGWEVTVPKHRMGAVDVHVHWTLGGTVQNDCILRYTYYSILQLPAAGTLPLARITGGTLFTLAATMCINWLSTNRKGLHTPKHR
ncbi:InlB B-repeat-containing protein [Bombiscardovia coagulans]|uniref:Regulator of chromosome condensation (RCC1) repeat n=1 Tax=Bombiscardovia coagulans TaxID=686666 RepID=A0A261EQV2_9BIFI|nr:InlB B-repeat-containing protein [Bombiscardovia coagulans]OZG49232.1 Regulator of chromosome condensation (RCC1) repeat [Bombiscardovia coagulans]